MNVTPNTPVTANLWIKGSGAIQFYVKAGAWDHAKLASIRCNAVPTWQICSLPVFGTGSNNKITLIMQDDYTNGQVQVVYFGDLVASQPGKPNLLANPGFENGSANWTRNNNQSIFTIVQNP